MGQHGQVIAAVPEGIAGLQGKIQRLADDLNTPGFGAAAGDDLPAGISPVDDVVGISRFPQMGQKNPDGSFRPGKTEHLDGPGWKRWNP